MSRPMQPNAPPAQRLAASTGGGGIARPRIWPALVLGFVLPFAAAVVASLALAFGMLLLAVVSDLDIDPAKLMADPEPLLLEMAAHPVGLLCLFLPGPVVFVLASLAGAHLSPEPLRERLGLTSRSAVPVWSYPILAMGTLFVGDALDLVVMGLRGDRGDNLTLFARITDGAGGLNFALLLVLIGILPGLAEEVAYRGYIQRRLLQRWHPALAIGLTSVLFGAAHFDPIHGLLAGALGLWLGLIAWRAASIVPAIICHTVNNLVATIFVRWIGFEAYSTNAIDSMTVWRLAAFGVAFAVSIVVLVSGGRSRPSDRQRCASPEV